MDKAFNDFTKKVCTDQARAVVGRVLNQYDILKNDKSLTDKQRFDALKAFNRELVYEQFRDLRNALIFYKEGRDYSKLNIYNPSKDS